MAGPSKIADSDSFMAMHMQLVEAGAGDVALASLLDLPQHAPPHPTIQRDAGLACALQCIDLQLARDADIARRLAASESGLRDRLATEPPYDFMLSSLSLSPTSCPICLELCTASASFVSSKCRHAFCAGCIGKYISVLAIEGKQFPVNCPLCDVHLDPQECLAIFVGTGQAFLDLERVILEQHFCSRIRYCANATCAMVFDWEDDPHIHGHAYEFKVKCPLCETLMCVNCKTLWHENKSCEQYRVEKESTDAMARLVVQNKWKPCPWCGIVIERRRGDCNFMRCRCGCGFCHQCGVAYNSLKSTRGNMHGFARCGCGLFRQPPQQNNNNGEDEIAEADEGPRAAQVRLARDPRNRVEHLPEPRPEELIPGLPALEEPHQDNVDHRYGDFRDHLDGFREGCNGVISVSSWLRGVMGQHLPPAMAADLVQAVCPYGECNRRFADHTALEQHLVSVLRHEVWLCCGRPFIDEHSFDMHRDSVHN